MASGNTIAKRSLRGLLAGYPGAGKTGALACLANAGLKLRVLDFDHNLEPLLMYTKPECLSNIDVLSFEDVMRDGPKHMQPNGLPKAFSGALKAMDRWKYTGEDGQEVDLGPSKEWGPDTVVVLDSLTTMGTAAFRRAQAVLNKTALNTTQQVWGLAMADQEAFIEKLTSPSNRFHVIVLSHLKMISPKGIVSGDDELTKSLKEAAAEIIPTKLFPSALGQQLPQFIGAHFPTLLLVERVIKGGKLNRVIRSETGPELDLKLPAINVPSVLPIEDGLLTIFNSVTEGVSKYV